MTRRLCAVLPVVVTALALAAAGALSAQAPPCRTVVPPGTGAIERVTWVPPWVMSRQDGRVTARPVVTLKATALAIRLDDRSEGTLRVRDLCAGREGCREEYVAEIIDATGAVRASRAFEPSYELFSLAAIDVVDGPGDEIFLVRIPAHSAPPIGHELQIWEIDGATLRDIGGPLFVAENLYPCGRTKTTLTIDVQSPKPRRIARQGLVGADRCCVPWDYDAAKIKALASPADLIFDNLTRQYRPAR